MILVTGASGTIGRALVRQLHARAMPFKALVRSAEKGRALGCDYVVGDFDQPDSLAAALRGTSAVFLNGPAGEGLVRQQTSVVELARAARVERIVKVSSRGADANAEIALARGHGVMERVLAESGVAWSVLRPSTFMQNLLRSAGSIRSTGKIFGAYGTAGIAFIDCEDIAACGVEALVNPARLGSIYTITGGEAVNYPGLAAKCAAALGKPVEYVDLPPERMTEQLKASGMPQAFAESMVRLMTMFAKGGGGQPTTTVRELLGREPRTVDQFFADNAAAFR